MNIHTKLTQATHSLRKLQINEKLTGVISTLC